MARFLTSSRLGRVTTILGEHYHERSSLRLFSTTPKISPFSNPSKLRKKMEQRDEKLRKVPQLAQKAENLVILSCESTAKGGVCDVYVVGGTHHDLNTCKRVQSIISYVKPQVVFLELCSNRAAALQGRKPEKFTAKRMAEYLLKRKTTVFHALQHMRSQEHASQVGGPSEVLVAYEEAKKYGAKVVLGDRPQQVTSRRMRRKLSLWQKSLFLYRLIFRKKYIVGPVWEIVIDERDKYMAHKLFEVARKNSSVVAVVGRAHLRGITKYWKQPIVVEDLMTIPPSNSFLTCLGVGVAAVAIISGIYFLP